MDKIPSITKIERIDDIPLLITQMEKMQVAQLLDKHFPTHGNWQGLSLGQVVIVWLSYILSQGDHRLNSVQSWAAGLLMTLTICLHNTGIRELDFSDDRLCKILDNLGNDDAWEAYEGDQNSTIIRVYDLKTKRMRIDSTTGKSYTKVTEDGLFQFGHSKEHRPDLPQLKINQSALDPLGLPLTTTIVSGNCADDPLYVPEIRKIQANFDQQGKLYVGDCKMAALDTRAYIAASHDYYLCPLSAIQMPAETLKYLLKPLWTGEQKLTNVHRAPTTELDKPVHIANGFSCNITITDKNGFQWQEQRLIVQSLKHANSQQKALNKRLKQAEQEINNLNLRGRGRKRLNEVETKAAVEKILSKYKVIGLLLVTYEVKKETTTKRAYLNKSATKIKTETVTVEVTQEKNAYDETVRELGWRVFVCNDLDLDLNEAVLAYREEYIVERGFNRYRSKILGLTPLFLSSSTRIKGLIRLLSIGLRVLCLVEFAVRESLREKNEKLDSIYAGNPKRSTTRPTTEMMLKVFNGISMAVISFGEEVWCSVTKLTTVQLRILDLLGFPTVIYQGLGVQSG